MITQKEGDNIKHTMNEIEETLRTSKMKINSKITNTLVCARNP